jgi:hypothetical protein
MSNWQSSTVSHAKLTGLADTGLLPCLTDARKWIKIRLEDFPQHPPRYVVSFIAFHKHAFSLSTGHFIYAVLWTYSFELQHLNPNGVQHLAAFEALCEGYLRVEVYWHLFCYFFGFACFKNEGAATIWCAALRLKRNRSSVYLAGPLTSSNNRWHSQ